MEKISILIPVWNRDLFISDCIISAIKQTYKNIQVLIYDDGSTDNTKEEISKIKDERIIMKYSNEHKGVSYARNELIQMCYTKYACWLDSDDLMNSYRVENQYNMIKENQKSYVIGNCRIFKNMNDIDITENEMSDNKQMGFASMMFENENLPLFDETLKKSEDTKWLKELGKTYKRIEMNRISYYIRRHRNRLGFK